MGSSSFTKNSDFDHARKPLSNDGVSVNNDIESKDEEVVEIIEEEYVDMGMPPFPPPPFAATPPPFPPPPFGVRPPPFVPPPFPPPPPMVIPPEWIASPDYEYEEVVSEEENGNDYYEEPTTSPINESAPPPLSLLKSAPSSSTKSIKSMRNETSDRMQAMGEVAAEKNKESDFKRYIRVFFKFLFTLAVLAVLVAGCLFIIWSFRIELNEKEKKFETSVSDSSFLGGSDYVWKLGNSTGADIVKSFYGSLAPLATITEDKDFKISGTISKDSKIRDFYAIRKLDDRTFFKMGEGNSAESFYIGSFQVGVEKLLDNGLSGRKVAVPAQDALIVRALVAFDNILFKKAFAPKNVKSSRMGDSFIEYNGKLPFEGADCDSIVFMEGDIKLFYFFDSKNHLLTGCEIIKDTTNVKIVYSDYKKFDSNYNIPCMRKIYLNGALIAEVNIRNVIRQRGIFFPR